MAVGKKIIHFSQKATVRGAEITVKVDPTTLETQISPDLKKKITPNTVILLQNGTRLTISPATEQTEELHEKNLVIVGKNDLKDVLIAPIVLEKTEEIIKEKYSFQVKNVDAKMHDLSRKLNISAILKPTNYSVELHKFLENPNEYNPSFEYRFPTEEKFAEIDILIEDLKQELSHLTDEDEIFRPIYAEKLQEIEERKNLILAYKKADYENIFHYNQRLFGTFRSDLLAAASEKVFEKAKRQSRNTRLLGKILTLDEIQEEIRAYLLKLRIDSVPVVISETTFSRMAVAYKKNSVQINLSARAIIREKELQSILSHEIGVHLRRYLAGLKTGLKIFETGVGYYLHDEEGLAVYQSTLHVPEDYEKNAIFYNYYLLSVADEISFSRLVAIMRSMFPERSWQKIFSGATRMKRGMMDTSVS